MMNIQDYFEIEYGITLADYDEPTVLEYLQTRYKMPLTRYYEPSIWGNKPITFCTFCLEKISGPCYGPYADGESDIEIIDLHESCAESPSKIQHPLHEHPLYIYYDKSGYSDYLCDGCFTLSASLKYRCHYCLFSLDFHCIVSNQLCKQREEKVIVHDPVFQEQDVLVRFYLPEDQQLVQITQKERIRCCCCQKGFQDSSGYFCHEREFFIHESCLSSLPEQVTKSSFHKQHPLVLSPVYRNGLSCKPCGGKIKSLALACKDCDLWFHVYCGKYTRAGLRYDDDDTFFLLGDEFEIGKEWCYICESEIDRPPVYKCIETDEIFHLECIVPSVLKFDDCHHHPLVLTSSIKPRDDDAKNYRCDLCEEEEVFDHYVYHCEECYFITHIECLVLTTWEKDILPLIDGDEEEVTEEDGDNKVLEIESEKMEKDIDSQQQVDKEEDIVKEDNKILETETDKIEEEDTSELQELRTDERNDKQDNEVKESEESDGESEDLKESSEEEQEADETEVVTEEDIDIIFSGLEDCSFQELDVLIRDVRAKLDNLTIKHRRLDEI